jgi:hypothetical protein
MEGRRPGDVGQPLHATPALTPWLTGRRTYDAIIAECAVRARATTLLTFNALHFQALDATQLCVGVPLLERGKGE